MPDRYAIHAELLFPGGGRPALADQLVEIENGCIVAIDDAGSGHAEASFGIVAPGFIDLQINGAGGVMFNDTPDAQTIARMAAAARIGGTCHILPTYITAPGTGYRDALAAVAACGGPEILGVHLEGPFLSPEKPGIHQADHIRQLDAEDMTLLLAHRGRILLTLAPEEIEPSRVQTLTDAGLILFVGHSNAGCDTVLQAAGAGLTGVTHLFNACSQLTAREPGVVGAALFDSRLFAGIIADGHHVSPRNLRLAHDLMKGRLFLVSDTMPTFGSDVTSFTVGDERITLENGRLTSGEGRLAGAHLGLDRAVRVMIDQAGVDVADALHMASGVPAAILGLTDQF
ncbi:MAG: N-acetylglucosamine-6-phosphate deacetylase, partial [Pseudomonadota bacterium]|nr:N-acetylglucosamine-6-phosphate deacetylase [Pseudomonadota bacterium]